MWVWARFLSPVPRVGIGVQAEDRSRSSITKVGGSVSLESGHSLAPPVLFASPNFTTVLSSLASQ